MSRVRINNFENEITSIMREYSDIVTSDLKEEIDKVAKEAVALVKKNSPVRNGKKRRKYKSSGKEYPPGSYKKSWTSKVTSENSYSKQRTIYNKEHYMLTHLLENGHMYTGRDGKRKTAPIVHIKLAEDFVIDELESRIKRRIKG